MYWYYRHAYHVAHFGGAASEDESDLFAAAGFQIVCSRAAKLSALDPGGNGCGGGGEQGDGCGELHVCGLSCFRRQCVRRRCSLLMGVVSERVYKANGRKTNSQCWFGERVDV